MNAKGAGLADKDAIIEGVKQQLAVANFQELLQKMTDKCYSKCITKPGPKLDNSESKCITLCMDRYMDVWNQTSKAYSQRIQMEGQRM